MQSSAIQVFDEIMLETTDVTHYNLNYSQQM